MTPAGDFPRSYQLNASRFDIVDDQGVRLIAGLSEFDASEHVRFWTSQGVDVAMVPAAEWCRETGRREIDPSAAEIDREAADIRAGWDRCRWEAQPGASKHYKSSTDYGRAVRVATSAAW